MKIKTILWFAILIITHCVISQETDSILQKAYKYNSKVLLEEFFMNWENASKLSDEEKLQINERINSDDTLNEIYKIANAFYKPIYTDFNYFLIEDTLKYEICYSDSIFSCESYSNNNRRSFLFYPFKLDIEDSRILYFNSKYNSLLQAYFVSQETDFVKLGDEYEAKRKIFGDKIQFYCKEIFSMKPFVFHKEDLLAPDLWLITINKELNKALLSYGAGRYSSETSLWEKLDGQWRFKKVRSQSTY